VQYALKRFYVVQDATRAAEGFSPTWYPHLWRVKLQPLVDSQEYKDILNNLDLNGDGEVDEKDQGILSQLSTYNKLIEINDAVVARAEKDVPKSGYDTSSFYTLAVGSDGLPADPTGLDSSISTNSKNGKVIDGSSVDADTSSQRISPELKINGYLTGDALPPNGESVKAGLNFPRQPVTGDFFLRIDYVPNRLFRYDGRRWIKIEDNVRTNLTPGVNNNSLRSGFINDNKKLMSGALARDIIKVSINYVPPANSSTISFTLSSSSPYGQIVTNVPFVSSYGISAQLNSFSIETLSANINGYLGFSVTSHPLSTGDTIDYTVYKYVTEERQNLSQIFRPKADNQ